MTGFVKTSWDYPMQNWLGKRTIGDFSGFQIIPSTLLEYTSKYTREDISRFWKFSFVLGLGCGFICIKSNILATS
jgi:hypothetical protein